MIKFIIVITIIIGILIYFYFKPIKINCLVCGERGLFYECKSDSICNKNEELDKLFDEIKKNIFNFKNEINKVKTNITNVVNIAQNRFNNMISILHDIKLPNINIPSIPTIDFSCNINIPIIDQDVDICKNFIYNFNTAINTMNDIFYTILNPLASKMNSTNKEIKRVYMSIVNYLKNLWNQQMKSFNEIIKDINNLSHNVILFIQESKSGLVKYYYTKIINNIQKYIPVPGFFILLLLLGFILIQVVGGLYGIYSVVTLPLDLIFWIIQ